MEISDTVKNAIQKADFIMLRYETEYTPCAGITAVTRQERRYFPGGVMIAPWCPNMPEAEDAWNSGRVSAAGEFSDAGRDYRILITTNDFLPVIYIGADQHFLGRENPYDTPDLKNDTLVFGLAVEILARSWGSSRQFVWGADWETVPSLVRLRDSNHLALTIHNTLDECLAAEAEGYGDQYRLFLEKRDGIFFKTALEVGLEIADVVTTVNRGFAYGMRNEPVQQYLMARHLSPLLDRVVGINNAGFSPPDDTLIELERLFQNDFDKGVEELRSLKNAAFLKLPAEVREKVKDKVIVVTMGRRVSQKQHDVFVEAVRNLLTAERDLPLLAFFATLPGDAGSNARLERMKKLQEDFPGNVVITEKRIPYYRNLMGAADYNCMPSLYEPHGGVYEGIVVPIARAVDSLAEQVCAFKPSGEANRFNRLWHSEKENPTGFLFREDPAAGDELNELRDLLEKSPSPDNDMFRRMVSALEEVLKQAVDLRVNNFRSYAGLVMGALAKQQNESWQVNLGGMLALVEEARVKRNIGGLNNA